MIKIYKLIHNEQIVYVGQTKQKYLSTRKAKGYGKTVPFYRECKIELIEETDDVSRERYWIERLRSEGHQLLNKQEGNGVSDYKEYYKEYNKEWIENNKEYHKEWRNNNKERNKVRNKKYREKNKVLLPFSK